MALMDVIVIGGGIAGVSIACELAADREVLLLEAESTLARHTTGRSAATWIDSYGPLSVRELSEASLPWLLDPPIEVDGPLLGDMGCLWLGVDGHETELRDLSIAPGVSLLNGDEAEALCPVLRPGLVTGAVYDERAKDLDVAGLHHAYVRAFKGRGGVVRQQSRVHGAERRSGRWIVHSSTGDHEAPIVVNAAGAWGDHIAASCGVSSIGLEPRRRTIFLSPPREPVGDFPFTFSIDESFYIKPEGEAIIGSPVDAEPQEPGDPRPDQLEIAKAIEAINETTTLGLRSVRTSWAGQRTFAPSGEPFAQFDDTAEDFYWFVGQGGWGIQIAPEHALRAAASIRSRDTR